MRGFGQQLTAGPSTQPLLTRALPMTVMVVVDPAVLSNLVANARAELVRSANADLSKDFYDRTRICKEEKTASECMNTLVTRDTSAFRTGLRALFQSLKTSGRKAYAEQLVPLLDRMISAETQMGAYRARYYVLRDYMAIFGTMPTVVSEREAQLVTTISVEPTPTPLPSTEPPSVPTLQLPWGAPLVRGEEEDIEYAPAVNGKPPYLLYVGIAAVVLGVGYLAMRKKS